jgi:murein DD-endopeptidase MepM/ murein hydrolase activator NlpD
VRPATANTPTSKRHRVVAALIAALGVCALSTGVAMAQSGGVTPPSEEPPPASGEPAPAPSTGTSQVHPLPGPHSYGDGFGAARGARSHQGADIFATCGQREVAVMNGRIVFSGYQGSAGNYLVIRNKKIKRDYVYMHMRKPGLPKGTKVVAGQWVGSVGDTGNASGCHLHFEIWKGKWYRGGYPLNPMPSLEAWDSYS